MIRVAAFLSQNLDADFAAEIHDQHPVDESCLIAVSGGRDSMAMLHFLHHHSYRNLTVIHVHHGLRGEEADADEALVRAFSEKLGHPCLVRKVDVAEHATAERVSLEEAARELRYQEFARIAGEENCPRIFLAHHADDQVETILFRFFRGSGARGLSGMVPHAHRKVDGVELELLRPWLEISGEKIDAYVANQNVPFREDLSNADDFSLRNRIRHRLLPTLTEIFERDVRAAVLRTAELAKRDEAWFEDHLPTVMKSRENGLDVATLRSLAPAIRDRVLLHWLRDEGVPDVGYREIERAVTIALSTDHPAKENLPGGIHIRRRQGVLFLEFPDDNPDAIE